MALFQSTLPRGSDGYIHWLALQGTISIHAPSRERLSLSFGGFKIILYFNPRSLAGATGMPDHRSPPPLGISIHAPSRERPLEMLTSKSLTHFNPRSLAGATAPKRAAACSQQISIHAPSRERQAQYQLAMAALQFQSTLPRGSDSILLPADSFDFYFNPRSLAGATWPW